MCYIQSYNDRESSLLQYMNEEGIDQCLVMFVFANPYDSLVRRERLDEMSKHYHYLSRNDIQILYPGFEITNEGVEKFNEEDYADAMTYFHNELDITVSGVALVFCRAERKNDSKVKIDYENSAVVRLRSALARSPGVNATDVIEAVVRTAHKLKADWGGEAVWKFYHAATTEAFIDALMANFDKIGLGVAHGLEIAYNARKRLFGWIKRSRQKIIGSK